MFFNRQLEKFRTSLRNQSIIDYFNIKSENVEDYIHILPNNDYCIITINYYNPGTYFEFPNLPLEINEYIYHFTRTKINIEVKVEPPDDYPFYPPIWSLLNVECITSYHINMREHLEYLISIHNHIYTLS